jgi:hypothetical protein
VLEEPQKRRQRSSRFADLGDRIARTFPSFDRTRPAAWHPDDEVDYPADGEPTTSWEEVVPRFPIVKSGYDCVMVDEHVADLERELAELERELSESQQQLGAQASNQGEVEQEIHRIGEQTSAILLAAHDKAAETTRRAQAEAEKCVADAAANAIAISEDANQKLRQLKADAMCLSRDRGRVLDDVRKLAGTLLSLADGAEERFPLEPQYLEPSTAAASAPASTEVGDSTTQEP